MAKIVVILGASNAGKDTAASVLPAYNTKFASPVKREVEKALGLKPHCIDSPRENCKEQALPLLIESHKHGQWVQQNIWVPQVIAFARELLEEGESLAFTDVRSSGERDAIINLADSFALTINTLIVHRNVAEMRESDMFLPSLIADFKYVSSLSADVLNDGTMEQFKTRVKQLYSVMV